MTNLEHLTDDELVNLYATGNNEAFDSLLNRHKSKLYTYILFATHDEDLANDIFQDTFVKIITCIQAGQYLSTGKFYAWCVRIAHNLIMDYHRQENINIFSTENNDGIFAAETEDLSDPSIEAQQIHAQNLKEIVYLYQQLPQAQSQIIQMRFYQDLSFKEIAEELGISINTALGRMRYALLNMKKIASEKNISFNI